MSKRANPAWIGAFVLGALTLGVVVILLLYGGHWFQEQRQQILYFEGATQGLQEGAPVVFLGVKVGTVKKIQLRLNRETCQFLVQVTIQIDPSVVQSHTGETFDLRDSETLRQLVDRGLRAQLQLLSILTGQRYVGLDFFPDKPAKYFGLDPTLNEIPTIPTTAEELTLKLEQFPAEKFLNDIAAISASLHKILSAPETTELPQQLNRTLNQLESFTARLNSESTSLLHDLRTDLVSMNRTLLSVKAAADHVAEQVDPDSPLFHNLTNASTDLAGAARVMRELSGEGPATVEKLNVMLQEFSRAARALRLLAETLEQQPEAIWRGKQILEEGHGD